MIIIIIQRVTGWVWDEINHFKLNKNIKILTNILRAFVSEPF